MKSSYLMWKCFIRNFEGVLSSGLTDEELIEPFFTCWGVFADFAVSLFPLNGEWLQSRFTKRPFHGRKFFLLFFRKRRAPHCFQLTCLADPVASWLICLHRISWPYQSPAELPDFSMCYHQWSGVTPWNRAENNHPFSPLCLHVKGAAVIFSYNLKDSS